MGFDFNSAFGDSEVSFECPDCGKEAKVKIKNVGKTAVKCSGCGVSIDVKPDKSFTSAKQTVDKSFKDLEKALKKLGK